MIGPLPPDELAALIAGGEDSFTEFKAPQVTNRDLAKELCAFSNAAGGRVLVGVEDDGSIVGAEGWDEERVMNVARTLIDPPNRAQIPADRLAERQADRHGRRRAGH